MYVLVLAVELFNFHDFMYPNADLDAGYKFY